MAFRLRDHYRPLHATLGCLSKPLQLRVGRGYRCDGRDREAPRPFGPRKRASGTFAVASPRYRDGSVFLGGRKTPHATFFGRILTLAGRRGIVELMVAPRHL